MSQKWSGLPAAHVTFEHDSGDVKKALWAQGIYILVLYIVEIQKDIYIYVI